MRLYVNYFMMTVTKKTQIVLPIYHFKLTNKKNKIKTASFSFSACSSKFAIIRTWSFLSFLVNNARTWFCCSVLFSSVFFLAQMFLASSLCFVYGLGILVPILIIFLLIKKIKLLILIRSNTNNA